jgi:malate dehydrogenase (oxaloacetate-decarboxylating)(NADP+)
VTSGAGAAALACLDLLVTLGVSAENIWVTDRQGVVYEGRSDDMDPFKARYAQKPRRAPWVRSSTTPMCSWAFRQGQRAQKGHGGPHGTLPAHLALANPDPEILPEEVAAVRDDAMMATGRSDYPNQVNNVLCFPFIFRGALDVGARTITDEMKVAAVRALADLARAESSELVAKAYGEEGLRFGPSYLIPKPFDPRLIVKIAPMVAKAAMESGVASCPSTTCGAIATT